MRIEYEDDEIIVVYKEAGLPVQAGRTSRKDLVSELKNYLALQASAASGDSPRRFRQTSTRSASALLNPSSPPVIYA